MNKLNNKNVFQDMPVAKAVKVMAVPTIVGQLVILIYNIADTFFIGRTNNPFMVAAVSLILPLFNIALPLGAIMGVGGGAMISKLLGENKYQEAKKVCSFSIYFSIILGIVYSTLIFVFMDPILIFLGAGVDTLLFSKHYATMVLVIGGIPTILTNVLSNLIRSVGESKKAGFGVTLGGIVNIILDPIFMFILLPRGSEVLGAGIATCVSNFISCIYFIIVIYNLKNNTSLELKFAGIPELHVIYKIAAVGIPAAIATLLFDIDYIVLDNLMSKYSDIALASIGIVLKAERLPLNVGIGICQGMVPLIAYNYAAKNYKRMNDIAKFSLFLGIICAIISIILYEIFAPFIMMFFISNVDTVMLGTNFLRIRCLATIFMFMSFYHVHLFNGYGEGGYALFLGVFRWAIINIPMLYILNYVIGIYGLVWSQLISDFIVVIVSIIVHKHYVNKNNLKQVIY